MALCAICHNTNETMQLCEKHRLENPGWCEGAREHTIPAMDMDHLLSSGTGYQLQGHTPRRRYRMKHRNLKPRRIATLHANYTIAVPISLRHRRSDSVQYVWVSCALLPVEIAWLCNCSVRYVRRVIHAGRS